MGKGKPAGIRAGRKLRIHRRNERWASKVSGHLLGHAGFWWSAWGLLGVIAQTGWCLRYVAHTARGCMYAASASLSSHEMRIEPLSREGVPGHLCLAGRQLFTFESFENGDCEPSPCTFSEGRLVRERWVLERWGR